MALLISPDAVPEAMRFVVRALMLSKDRSYEEAELLALLAPPGLVESMTTIASDPESGADDEGDLKTGGRAIASQSIDALATLELVAKEKGQVRLADNACSRWKHSADVTAQDFSFVLLENVLARGRGVRPFGSSKGSDDLVQALALLYAADEALRGFGRFEGAKGAKAGTGRTFVDYQMKETDSATQAAWPVGNVVRWLPFVRWAVYLGVARMAGGSLLPEASSALIPRLIGKPKGQHPVMDFVDWCAEVLSFLDGGEHCHFPRQREGDNVVLSPGVSATLLQMEALGAVKLARLSDDRNATLRLRADRVGDRAVSTVEWFGASLTRKAAR
jgi:hypothetical protein